MESHQTGTQNHRSFDSLNAGVGVSGESVGFILNRIWAALKRESLEVVEEGVSTPTEVDHIFELVLGGTHGGPFRLMDKVGLDVALDIEEHYAAIHPELPSEPRELLKQYIKEGRLGLKTGKGFYIDYGQGAGRGVRGALKFDNLVEWRK